MITAKTRSILIFPAILALLGALFCAWNSLDSGSVPCITEGCTLFQTFTIGGFSLWWAGVGLFSLLTLLALVGAAGACWFISGLALSVDCMLMVIMLLTAPCFACLVVAVMLALCFWRFREEFLHPSAPGRSSRNGSKSWLLALWGILFVVNLGLATRSAVTPWPIQTPQENAPAVNIYFSPSCSACRQLVLGMPATEAEQVAWFPVVEEGQGLYIIDSMHKSILEGVPLDKAFTTAMESPAPTLWASLTSPRLLVLQFRLWVNQAHVLRAGGATLPMVEFRGVPEALLKPARNHPTPVAVPTPRSNSGSAPSGGMTPRTGDMGGAAVDLPFLNLQSVGECRDGKTPAGTDCP